MNIISPEETSILYVIESSPNIINIMPKTFDLLKNRLKSKTSLLMLERILEKHMKYSYIAINQTTSKPVVGGHNKYHLRHAVTHKQIEPNEVRFYRVAQPIYPNLSKVVELTLEDVMKD